MIERFIIYGMFWGLLGLVILSPRMLYKGVYEMCYGDLSSTDKITSWIPIYNTYAAEKMYLGGIPWITVSTICMIISVLLRYVVVFCLPRIVIVTVLTVAFFCISFIASLILNMRLVFLILNDTEVNGFTWRILVSIGYPYGQYWIGANIRQVVNNMSKDKETFK